MPNRLARATSPYLLQHAANPVDWWEWCDDAFAEARRRDVPVLLSIGYAACHWCHVMAHESFEDPRTAAVMNTRFVNIKVDREERPDVDAVYMDATQAMTGHGGWPMTVFLTPDGVPFSAGTYYPPSPRHGLPGFTQLLEAVDQAWRTRRAEIDQAGQRIVEALGRVQALPPSRTDDVATSAVDVLARQLDQHHAGFGGAPKFPPSMVCEFLLRRAARTGDERALDMAGRTYEAMARGGMYDQLGGGFARYSVDARWAVPHFEKMLYDNALLLRGYLHWWRQSGTPLGERVARETADFLLRELQTDEGGFASSLDADSDGREGAFYVWTQRELRDVLGDDADRAADLWHVTPHGTFERGASTLQLHADPDDPAWYADVRQRLLDARARRTRPGRDDKVVAAWNGLAVAALAEAGVLLDEPRYLEAATRAAQLLVTTHLVDGRLRRVSRAGVAGAPDGVLDDLACVADGLLVLHGVTGDVAWFTHARALVDDILARFVADDANCYDTAADAEALYKRPADVGDNATPSGQAMTADVLVTLGALTGDSTCTERAERMLERVAGVMEQTPRFTGHWLTVGEALLAGPTQVAVVGPDADALVAAALRRPDPGLVLARAEVADDTHPVALLHGREAVDGLATAYVCRDFTCDLPTHDPRVVTG